MSVHGGSGNRARTRNRGTERIKEIDEREEMENASRPWRKLKVIRVLSDPSVTNWDRLPVLYPEEGNFIFPLASCAYSLLPRCYFTCWLLDISLGLLQCIRNIDRPQLRGSRGEVGSGYPAKTSATPSITWLGCIIMITSWLVFQGRAHRERTPSP